MLTSSTNLRGNKPVTHGSMVIFMQVAAQAGSHPLNWASAESQGPPWSNDGPDSPSLTIQTSFSPDFARGSAWIGTAGVEFSSARRRHLRVHLILPFSRVDVPAAALCRRVELSIGFMHQEAHV